MSKKIFISFLFIFIIFSSSLSAKSFRLWMPNNKFSPNSDGIEDEIEIYIYLREDALITLKIKNYEDKLINTLAENTVFKQGKHIILWDGKDSYGKIVSDGKYYVELAPQGFKDKKEITVDCSFYWKMPKMVLAFYYTWYGTKKVSGRWLHWDESGHNPDIRKANGRPDIGSTHHPLELYDSSDEKVIKKHLKIAEEYGIQGFIATWWGKDTREDKIFSQLLKLAEKSKVKISIYYEIVPEDNLDNAISDFIYILKNYSKSPAFLKIEGKPVIFIFSRAIFQLPSDAWKKVIDEVKKNYEVIFIADVVATTISLLFEGLIKIFDGVHIYNPVVDIQRKLSLEDEYKKLVKLARRYKKISCATIIPGYDDSNIGREFPIILSRENGKLYENLWKSVINSNPDWILITSFNEWHEGTEIELSVEWGEKFLKLTKKYSKIFLNR